MHIKNEYIYSKYLVSTEWVFNNIKNTNVRIIESNEDLLLYYKNHIPGAIHIDWRKDLQDDIIRDYISPKQFSDLCINNGIYKDTICVFYGNKSNWWACYALWTFQLFGHEKTKIMNGGRKKWIQENKPMTKKITKYSLSNYPIPDKKNNIRSFFDETLFFSKNKKPIIDVRSKEEFNGDIINMPEYPQEGALRGGHIPGAINVPWQTAINENNDTFKTYEELKNIYEVNLKLNPKNKIIVYCRIGERSSHTWFVLKFLLGFNFVLNYDGSWTEWGNKVMAPIER